jgi:hypothetical protein
MEEILASPLPPGGCAQLYKYWRYGHNIARAQAYLNEGIITTTVITSETVREVLGVKTRHFRLVLVPSLRLGFFNVAFPAAQDTSIWQ